MRIRIRNPVIRLILLQKILFIYFTFCSFLIPKFEFEMSQDSGIQYWWNCRTPKEEIQIITREMLYRYIYIVSLCRSPQVQLDSENPLETKAETGDQTTPENPLLLKLFLDSRLVYALRLL